jgi:hypothetical protein
VKAVGPRSITTPKAVDVSRPLHYTTANFRPGVSNYRKPMSNKYSDQTKNIVDNAGRRIGGFFGELIGGFVADMSLIAKQS